MKDIYITFSEALKALTPEQTKKFNELRKPTMTVETQLAVIESITVAPSVKESRGPITKHNGAGDNGTLFIESARSGMTETVDPHRAKSDKILREALGIPEPKQPEGLTSRQMAEYRFGLGIGLSESVALGMAKAPFRK